MEINIVHESDGFVLRIDGKYFGTYDTPVQAAQVVEEYYGDEKKEEKIQNANI